MLFTKHSVREVTAHVKAIIFTDENNIFTVDEWYLYNVQCGVGFRM